MVQDIQLDEVTKQSLAEEVERLVRMGMDKKQARRIVWEDYQDELAAYAAPAQEPAPQSEPPEPEPNPPETPVPEPPKPEAVTKTPQEPPEGRFFTPDRLARNRSEIQKVKQFLASRRAT